MEGGTTPPCLCGTRNVLSGRVAMHGRCLLPISGVYAVRKTPHSLLQLHSTFGLLSPFYCPFDDALAAPSQLHAPRTKISPLSLGDCSSSGRSVLSIASVPSLPANTFPPDDYYLPRVHPETLLSLGVCVVWCYHRPNEYLPRKEIPW